MAGYIGSKAVNLSTTGADINGDANIDGDLSFRDNDKAIFGAGSDLQIYHNANNSYIQDVGTGKLHITSDGTGVSIDKGTSELMATFDIDGAVTLYHDNSQKLATESGGVNITGVLTSDGLTVDGNVAIGLASTNTWSTGYAIEVGTEQAAIWGAGDQIDITGNAYFNSGWKAAATKAGASKYEQALGNHNFAVSGSVTADSAITFKQALNIASNGDISFYEDTGTTPKFFWDASAESLGIGTSSPDKPLHILSTTPDQIVLEANSTTTGPNIIFKNTDGNLARIASAETNTLRFEVGPSNSEAMRIEANGRLLVGKTAQSLSSAGFEVEQTGQASFTQSGASCIRLNRLSSDGTIIQLRKDTSQVGSIGAASGHVTVGNGPTGLRFVDASTDRISPWNLSTNTDRDNAIDLGESSGRFDDIYATNGTIQTSDRNEKQDIAELSDAEQRVAVAAKGLLRKFRWRDSVEAKGNEARTHFGIIAQDLQAAFAAEELDAGDYAMFISSTWTDEETGEERTRMGVRYSELLAFIIGAL